MIDFMNSEYSTYDIPDLENKKEYDSYTSLLGLQDY